MILFIKKWKSNTIYIFSSLTGSNLWTKGAIANGPGHAKMSYVICEQQRRRSACASSQSDQHLCCSVLRWYDMYTCYIQSFKILASFCSWAGWFKSYLVENPGRHIFVWRGSNKDLVNFFVNIWATTQQNMSSGVSDQARHKPACAATEAS